MKKMETYHNYPRIQGMSINERVFAFKETIEDMLCEGWSIEEIRATVDNFENDEMYEAAQGILDAINNFEC